MKKGKRLLSMLLAAVFVMTAVGATLAASAAEEKAYAPTYTENVTKEDVADLIGDVDTIIGTSFLTGATIESFYKFLPALKSLVMLDGSSAKASDKGVFYQTTYPERFADFPDGQIVADTVDENGNVTAPGTFTQFFKDHPIACDTQEAFVTELDKIIDMIIVPNIMTTVIFAFAMSGDMDTANTFTSGLDNICAAFGIAQEKTALEAIGLDDFDGDEADLRAYVKNILHAVLPNPVDSILTLLRGLTVDENAAALYQGLGQVLGSLNKLLGILAEALSGLGVDLSTIQNAITGIYTIYQALPTIEVGEGQKKIDLEGSLSYLADSLTEGMVSIQFGDAAPAGEALIQMQLEHMDFSRIAQAETNGDVLKIVYDYVYRNLIGNDMNRGIVLIALGMLGLSEETVDQARTLFEMSDDDLLDYMVDQAAIAAGREPKADPVEPTQPTEPTEPSQTEPSTQATEPTQPEKNTDTGDSALAGFVMLAAVAAGALVFVSRKK